MLFIVVFLHMNLLLMRSCLTCMPVLHGAGTGTSPSGGIIFWDVRDWQAVHNADVVEDKSTGNNFTCPLRSVLEHSTRTVDTPKP